MVRKVGLGCQGQNGQDPAVCAEIPAAVPGVLHIFSLSSTLVSHPGPIFSQQDAYPIFLLTLILAFSALHVKPFLSLGTGGSTKTGINKRDPERHFVSCPFLNSPSAPTDPKSDILPVILSLWASLSLSSKTIYITWAA